MTQGTKRLTEELHRLEGLKLREILDEMAKTGSPTVVLSFNGTQDKPVAAVALITGPDTADRIEALENPNQDDFDAFVDGRMEQDHKVGV